MSTVRRLTVDDVEPYVALRKAMLEEAPTAFLADVASDIGCNPERMRENIESGDDNAVFGAFGDVLVGVVGIGRFTRHIKARHRADLWGMYVDPAPCRCTSASSRPRCRRSACTRPVASRPGAASRMPCKSTASSTTRRTWCCPST